MSKELTNSFLLEDFIGIYEVVADIRLAQREGRLATYLGLADESASGSEMAKLICARLTALIDGKLKRVRNYGTKEQQLHQRMAIYAAASLIDEIFILEEDWSGADAWLEDLLEYRLFRTRKAGRHFFEIAETLVLRPSLTPQLSELAAIFLLALRLGFYGQCRGSFGSEYLELLRRRLLERIMPEDMASIESGIDQEDAYAFPQSYRFILEGKEQRLAPLKPWLMAAGAGLLAYLLLSSAIWLAMMQPFLSKT